MNKYILIIIALSLSKSVILAHCQVPCGIYDDALRIIQIKEDFRTIDKSISKINNLSKFSDPLTLNQIIDGFLQRKIMPLTYKKLYPNIF